jgi:hypothetical protein
MDKPNTQVSCTAGDVGVGGVGDAPQLGSTKLVKIKAPASTICKVKILCFSILKFSFFTVSTKFLLISQQPSQAADNSHA